MGDSGRHPAKLAFLTIRVFLNREMQQLDDVLRGAFQRLRPGGRCSIISSQRKEASAVTRFVREYEAPSPYVESLRLNGSVSALSLCELYPLLTTAADYRVEQLCEPIRPSTDEITRQSRWRSSAVHVLRKEPHRCPFVTLVSPSHEPGSRYNEPFVAAEIDGATGSSQDAMHAHEGPLLPRPGTAEDHQHALCHQLLPRRGLHKFQKLQL